MFARALARFKQFSTLREAEMDSLFQKAFREIDAAKKTSFPWTRDVPYPQPYFTFSSESKDWQPINATSSKAADKPSKGTPLTKLSLLSWNIDFMLPHPRPRMVAALAHLHSLIQTDLPSTYTVIFLQEMVASDLSLLQSTLWVRTHFHLTDLTPAFWESGYYGTCTLVDRRLPITSVFRVHYSATNMERDALFVDVLPPSSSTSSSPLRLCNSHLESLAMDPPLRPKQVQIAAKFMHEETLHASLAAGDFNAIQPFDRTLHSDNDLHDAYLSLGGKEDSDDGYTWGQQAATTLRDRFGCSRMDKVFFCGGLQLKTFDRFGRDVLVEGKREQREVSAIGFEKPWVTDHLGVRANFEITTEKRGS